MNIFNSINSYSSSTLNIGTLGKLPYNITKLFNRGFLAAARGKYYSKYYNPLGIVNAGDAFNSMLLNILSFLRIHTASRCQFFYYFLYYFTYSLFLTTLLAYLRLVRPRLLALPFFLNSTFKV